MGLIGREIQQTRVYDDPSVKIPNLNYKHIFPITVFDAVRLSMDDEESITLTQVLEEIHTELRNRQPIFPGRPANFLMTFAGSPGEVGGIQMSREIPWDPAQQSHDRIPTEKAVGTLMYTLGLLDETGKPIDPNSRKVRWSDVIGRPLLYDGLGSNVDGFMSQKATTDAINAISGRIDTIGDLSEGKFNTLVDQLRKHIENYENPHGVTADTIGAASAELLRLHIEDRNNPHGITPELLGLGNVEDTRDIDKPISKATQEAIDALNAQLSILRSAVGDLDYVSDAQYDRLTGQFLIIFRSGKQISLYIPINGLVDEIAYDNTTKDLVFSELSGLEKRISLIDLCNNIVGSDEGAIRVIVEKVDDFHQTVKAVIKDKSITENMFADGAVGVATIEDNSITGVKLKDLAVDTQKLSDRAVTREKLAQPSVFHEHLGDRIVDGKNLFSSSTPNRILGVLNENTDPTWTQVISEMIHEDVIDTKHLRIGSITTEKLAEQSVTEEKLGSSAVTEPKIARDAVTTEKLADRSVTSEKIVKDVFLYGTPSLETRPLREEDNNQIPDTHWIRQALRDYVGTTENIGDRTVTGEKLFTSSIPYRILAVTRAGSDPVWTQVTHDMVASSAIGTDNLRVDAVTNTKIANNAVETRHISEKAILSRHIADGAVDDRTLYRASGAGWVLGTVDASGRPGYTKITSEMYGNASITGNAIRDLTINPSKLEPAADTNMVLISGRFGTSPGWSKIRKEMMSSRSVDGTIFMTSTKGNVILSVGYAGSDPEWSKVSGVMLEDHLIQEKHLNDDLIGSNHIKDKAIERRHLADDILPDKDLPTSTIPDRSITGKQMQTSEIPYQVFAVLEPFTDPIWTSIIGEMFADESITKEKLFRSRYPYQVLGATQPDAPPEYLKITHQFIVDGSITGVKLEPNTTFTGTPTITAHPAENADNYQIASTKWVRKTVGDLFKVVLPRLFAAAKDPNIFAVSIDDLIPNGIYDSIPPADGFEFDDGTGIKILPVIQTDMLADRAVTGKKLFTSPIPNKILAVLEPNGDPRYSYLKTEMIEEGAVTGEKIERHVVLPGHPSLELNPAQDASSENGNGKLIATCQWVINKIEDELERLGIGGKKRTNVSISDRVIENIVSSSYNETREEGEKELELNELTEDDYRIIREEGDDSCCCGCDGSGTPGEGNTNNGSTGSGGGISIEEIEPYTFPLSKLESTKVPNSILAVLEGSRTPVWTKIRRDMLEERLIDGSRLFSSSTANRILGVTTRNGDPVWTKVTQAMLETDIIGTQHLMDNSVTGDKLEIGIIERKHIADKAIVDEALLKDDVVSNSKIKDGAVDGKKIPNETITSDHLKKDLELKGNPTVKPNINYEKRSVRNIILSPSRPTTTKDFQNGDIWFQYI